MTDWILAHASAWIGSNIVPWLMTYSVVVVGGAILLCFFLQIVTGKIVWAKRAIWTLALGCIAIAFIYG